MAPGTEYEESTISKEDVRHVALLSRLELAPDEVEAYSSILNRILSQFRQLNELETEGVPPTSHPAPIVNVLREDEVRPSLSPDEALANAPDSEAGCFVEPRVIG